MHAALPSAALDLLSPSGLRLLPLPPQSIPSPTLMSTIPRRAVRVGPCALHSTGPQLCAWCHGDAHGEGWQGSVADIRVTCVVQEPLGMAGPCVQTTQQMGEAPFCRLGQTSQKSPHSPEVKCLRKTCPKAALCPLKASWESSQNLSTALSPHAASLWGSLAQTPPGQAGPGPHISSKVTRTHDSLVFVSLTRISMRCDVLLPLGNCGHRGRRRVAGRGKPGCLL